MEEERRFIEEEQHNNSYINYDLMVTQALDSTSRISQWLPDVWRPEGQDYPLQRLILGANTPLQKSNHLVIAKVNIPKHRPLYSVNRSNSCTIEIETSINHPGEVIKACYMPQNPSIIATRATSSDVLVFDYTKQPYHPDPNGKCSPELILRGHKKKGYGLSWNPYESGELISGSEDHTVRLWNINHMPSEERVIDAITIFKDHTSIVNDVQWYCHSANVFGSVANDRKFIIWDTRCNETSRIAHAHDANVNCLSFNPIREFILATGSADETVALWDIRYLKFKLLSLDFHKNEICQVQWSPKYEKVLASRDGDGLIFFSDLSQIGTETSAGDDDESPEVIFIHGGYSSNIFDFSWNLNELFTLCSVEEDNILQVWQNT